MRYSVCMDNYIDMLSPLGFHTLTPVQETVIAAIAKGKNVLFQSDTGTGKTFAYLLPLIRRIKEEGEKSTSIIIVSPTLELASQIRNMASQVTDLKTTLLFSTSPIKRQIEALKEKSAIMVGSAKRLYELISIKKIKTKSITAVVFDEVDKLVKKETAINTRTLLNILPSTVQVIGCSATVTAQAIRFFGDIAVIKMPQEGVLSSNIEHWAIFAEQRDKMQTLKSLIHALNSTAPGNRTTGKHNIYNTPSSNFGGEGSNLDSGEGSSLDGGVGGFNRIEYNTKSGIDGGLDSTRYGTESGGSADNLNSTRCVTADGGSADNFDSTRCIIAGKDGTGGFDSTGCGIRGGRVGGLDSTGYGAHGGSGGEGDAVKVLVFAERGYDVEKIVSFLTSKGVQCAALYAKSDTQVRKAALDRFRSGKVGILVTSDLSARGLDIQGITHVIQVGLGDDDTSFIHRAGRTARALRHGVNIVIGEEAELMRLSSMEKRLGIKVFPKALYGGQIVTA